MNDPVLTAHDLYKSYPSGDRRIEVLRGVSLEVGSGESVSIQGESGSGKSTLLNLLAGLDQPDRGEVRWSKVPELNAAHRATFLGMVFQSYYLIPELNAEQNVFMACRVAGNAAGRGRRRTEELLARVGLQERVRHLPAHLSGGERQRVAIARALVNEPGVVLADEPTGNLDEQTGKSVMDLLLALCREEEVALVLVTHNKRHARRTRRQMVLHLGHLSEIPRRPRRAPRTA